MHIKVALKYSSSVTDVKNALNDLPTLYPNMVLDVNVTLSLDGNDVVYNVIFSPDIGMFISLFLIICIYKLIIQLFY